MSSGVKRVAGDCADDFSRPDELLAVVDSDDVETGSERRDVIHRDNLLHRAIHLIVTNGRGEILIQKRSGQKDTFPFHWECVGGHLSPGETYEAAAVREIGEELGVEASEMDMIGKLTACAETGWEFITVFTTRIDVEPNPNPGEVIATEWISPEDFRWEIRETNGKRKISPSFLYTLRQTGFLER